MKFQPGQSGNPNGRKKGSSNKATKARAELRDILETESKKLLKAACAMAAAEPSVMTALLDRMLPKLKPVELSLQAPIQADAAAEVNAQAILKAVAEGELTLESATGLLAAINQVTAINRLGDIERAVADLFRQLGKEPPVFAGALPPGKHLQ